MTWTCFDVWFDAESGTFFCHHPKSLFLTIQYKRFFHDSSLSNSARWMSSAHSADSLYASLLLRLAERSLSLVDGEAGADWKRHRPSGSKRGWHLLFYSQKQGGLARRRICKIKMCTDFNPRRECRCYPTILQSERPYVLQQTLFSL